MPVPLNPPYVRPQTPEKSFEVKFYTDFATNAKSPTEGDIYIRSVPMAADGELAHDQEQLTRCNLWQAAAAIPEAAEALSAVMTALPLIEAWAATQNEEP